MSISAAFEDRLAPSMGAYAQNTAALSASAIRLGTGIRIINAGDDAASLSTATRLKAENSALRSSLANGAHATSYLQVAYSGLDQIRSILQSLADLTTTATSSGRTARDYTYLDAQFQTRKAQIDTIVAATTFNGASMLDGSASGAGTPQILVGDASGGTIALSIPSVTVASLFSGAVSIGSHAAATSATSSVSDAQAVVDDALAKVDAYQVRLDVAGAATTSNVDGITRGINALIGTDATAETTARDSLLLRQNTAAALIAQAFSLNGDLLRLVH